MNRTLVKLVFCTLLYLLLTPYLSAASASSPYGQQEADMNALQQLALFYSIKHGQYPKTDSQGTWFEKLVADDPWLSVHFGTTPNGSLPTDMHGFPIVYEPPANPNAKEQLAVIRCVGMNGIDDKGRLDDWDLRYGPNLGYWYKTSWPRLYARTGVCAFLALLGLALLARLVRPWSWVWLIGAVWAGFLACVVLPAGFDASLFRHSASSAPNWLDIVALLGAVLLLVGGVPSLLGIAARINLWRTGAHRRQLGCCIECGYDLCGTIAAGRRSCPECGSMIPRPEVSAAGRGQGD